MALIELVEEITNRIDGKNYAMGIFVKKKHLTQLIMR